MSIKKTLTAIVASAAIAINCQKSNPEIQFHKPIAALPVVEEQITPCVEDLKIPCVEYNDNKSDSNLTTEGRNFLSRAGLTKKEIHEIDEFSLEQALPILNPLDPKLSESSAGTDIKGYFQDLLAYSRFLRANIRSEDLPNSEIAYRVFEFRYRGIPTSFIKSLNPKIRDPTYIKNYYDLSHDPNIINCIDEAFLHYPDEMAEIIKENKACKTKGYSDNFSIPEVTDFILANMNAQNANAFLRAYINGETMRDFNDNELFSESYLENDYYTGPSRPLSDFFIEIAKAGIKPRDLYRIVYQKAKFKHVSSISKTEADEIIALNNVK